MPGLCEMFPVGQTATGWDPPTVEQHESGHFLCPCSTLLLLWVYIDTQRLKRTKIEGKSNTIMVNKMIKENKQKNSTWVHLHTNEMIVTIQFVLGESTEALSKEEKKKSCRDLLPPH